MQIRAPYSTKKMQVSAFICFSAIVSKQLIISIARYCLCCCTSGISGCKNACCAEDLTFAITIIKTDKSWEVGD